MHPNQLSRSTQLIEKNESIQHRTEQKNIVMLINYPHNTLQQKETKNILTELMWIQTKKKNKKCIWNGRGEDVA
jgi:hypothetical protein